MGTPALNLESVGHTDESQAGTACPWEELTGLTLGWNSFVRARQHGLPRGRTFLAAPWQGRQGSRQG